MADFTVEAGTLQRVADAGGNPVLRLDTNAHAGYLDMPFADAGSGVSGDPLTTDADGHLYLAGKKHTRNGTTASVDVMPGTKVMRLGYRQIAPTQACLLVGIGGGSAAYHHN